MKKIKLFSSALFLTFLFFSCATTKDVKPEDFSQIQSEEESDSQNDEEPIYQDEENTENDLTASEKAQNDEESDENADEDDEVELLDYDDDWENLPEIEEPLIRELEIQNEIEDAVEVADEEANLDEMQTVELVETEELPEIEDVIEPKESAQDDTQTEDEDEDEDEIEEVLEDSPNEAEAEDGVESVDSPEVAPEEEVIVEVITPSRSVTMKLGEYLDLTYPGKGWVYLGAIDGSKNLTRTERKLGNSDTSFVLLARNEGTSILHFYKEDVLADKYIDDYIEVTVLPERSKSKAHVKAQDYAEVVPAKPAPKPESKIETKAEMPEQKSEPSAKSPSAESSEASYENKPSAQKEREQSQPAVQQEPKTQNNPGKNSEDVQNIIQKDVLTAKTPKIDQNLSPEELLLQAKSAFDEKDYQKSYNLIQDFLSLSSSNRDEGLLYLAKIYESKSDLRDIKKSIETYEQIKNNYPASKYWDEANNRIIYLQRFYINIR